MSSHRPPIVGSARLSGMLRTVTTAGVVFLSACGGGNDAAEPPPAPATTVLGTAASGRPLAGATVTLKDASGNTAVQTTAADGSFVFPDIGGFNGSLVAQVSGGTLGCADRSGCTARANTDVYVGAAVQVTPPTQIRINLTPLSTAVVSAAIGTDAAQLFARPVDLATLSGADLNAAQVNVLGWLRRLDPEASVPAGLDTLQGAFAAVSADPHDRVLETLDAALSVLQLDLAQFTALVLTDFASTSPPVVALFCDVAGSYQGVFGGSNSGIWSVSLDSHSGQITGQAVSADGEVNQVIGSVTRIGVGSQRTSAAMGVSGVSSFVGGISSELVLAGAWSNPFETGGTFSGQRVAPAEGCH